MKRIFYFMSILAMILFTACNDVDVFEPVYGDPIDPVTDLKYSISGNIVTITWVLPSSYPDDIVQPVSIYLVFNYGGQKPMTMVLPEAPISFVFDEYNPEMSYKAIVKVLGYVDKNSEAVGVGGDYRLSLGQTIYF